MTADTQSRIHLRLPLPALSARGSRSPCAAPLPSFVIMKPNAGVAVRSDSKLRSDTPPVSRPSAVVTAWPSGKALQTKGQIDTRGFVGVCVCRYVCGRPSGDLKGESIKDLLLECVVRRMHPQGRCRKRRRQVCVKRVSVC